MDLNAKARIYVSINSYDNSIRYKMKYLGFDSKEFSASYAGSSTTANFINDKPFMTTITIAEGTVEQMYVLEQLLLMAVNAKSSPDFYNESNSNGYDLDIKLDPDCVSREMRDAALEKLLSIAPTKLDDVEVKEANRRHGIVVSALAYANNPTNILKELLSKVWLKINDDNNIQVRQTLFDESHALEISIRMLDEKRAGLDPADEARPVVLVDGDIANGHHTTYGLHKIGHSTVNIVNLSLEEHFDGDWELVKDFGELINKQKYITKVHNKQDCMKSIQRYVSNWLTELGLEVTDSRLLTSMRSEHKMKSLSKKVLMQRGYTSATFSNAWGDLEKKWSLGKLIGSKTLVPWQNVSKIIGQTRKELIKSLESKYSAVSATQKFTVADIGNAHSAAIRVLANGADKCVLVLSQDVKAPILDSKERNRILDILKKDLMVGRTEVPNIRIVIMPVLDDDKLFEIEAKDI